VLPALAGLVMLVTFQAPDGVTVTCTDTHHVVYARLEGCPCVCQRYKLAWHRCSCGEGHFTLMPNVKESEG
jgi:hypothetical protein